MHTKSHRFLRDSRSFRRLLPVFLSLILMISLLSTAAVTYGASATITLANYNSITLGVTTKAELQTTIGDPEEITASGMSYLGAADDPKAVRKVSVTFDSWDVVIEKKIEYAFDLDEDDDDLCSYTGIATKLTVPAYVNERLYLESGFPAIEKTNPIVDLQVAWRGLTALNVTKCTKLKFLTCHGNKLTKLNLKKCTKLQGLECSNNKLTTLNVTKNLKLTGISCSKNKLKKLNVTKNKKLFSLTCDRNALTKLNVTKNKKLAALDCSRNKLKKLNVNKNPQLYYIGCNNNKIKTLNLSRNLQLDCLKCYSNKIKTLNLSKQNWLEILEVDKKLKKSQLPKHMKKVKPKKHGKHWDYILIDP